MQELKDRVREYRKARGMTQNELAMRAGVDQGTVSNIERGYNSKTSVLLKIAEVLEVEVANLMGPSTIEAMFAEAVQKLDLDQMKVALTVIQAMADNNDKSDKNKESDPA